MVVSLPLTPTDSPLPQAPPHLVQEGALVLDQARLTVVFLETVMGPAELLMRRVAVVGGGPEHSYEYTWQREAGPEDGVNFMSPKQAPTLETPPSTTPIGHFKYEAYMAVPPLSEVER